jgi:hypothetical protein
MSGHAQHEQGFGAAVGIKVGYQYFWAGRVFARADVTTDVTLGNERVVTDSKRGIFSTPSMYVTVALGLGVWF